MWGLWYCVETLYWQPDMSTFEYTGLVLSMGIASGLGINVAHELIHKLTKTEPVVGRCLLWLTCYGHFETEHIMGHHKRVSTEDDPASSRLNESLYSFYFRSVFLSFLSALHLERTRLALKQRSFWSLHNRIIVSLLVSFVLIPSLLFHF